MNKKISELFNDYGDEIVVADEINDMFDPEEIKEITMKKIYAETIPVNAGKARRITRRAAGVAIAACFALALAASAYAVNFFGIRELWQTPIRELPEEAANLIERQGETAAAAEGWSARITESLCDVSNAMVSLTVSGGDRYIVVPTDAMPEDPVSAIGLDGSETLAEYAAAQGKTLLFAGARLEGLEELGNAMQEQYFRNLSDGEMAILIRADKTVSLPSFDTVCTVYVLADGTGEVQRLQIPLTLTETPSEVLELTPNDPDAVPGLRIGSATVTTTPLGIDMTFPVNADDTAIRAIASVTCDELSGSVGGFVREDGVWCALWTMEQGNIGDTLTVHFYGADDAPLGDVVFTK